MTEPATPSGVTAADDRTLMLVLSYLWVLALIPLLTHKTDAEIQWHAKHGLILTVVEVLAFVAWWTFLSVLWIMTAGLFGCVLAIQLVISPLVGLAVLALHAAAVIEALKGRRVMIPVISAFASRL